MNPKFLLIAYALFIPFWLYCSYRCIRFMRETVKEFAPSSFNFYFTDMWAGILALLPCYLLARQLIDARGQVFELSIEAFKFRINLLDVTILALSQIFGMAIGRLYSIKRADEHIPRRLEQAVRVFTGGLLIGPLMLAGIIFLFALLALGVSMAIWCPPCFIAVVWASVVLYWRRKSMR